MDPKSPTASQARGNGRLLLQGEILSQGGKRRAIETDAQHCALASHVHQIPPPSTIADTITNKTAKAHQRESSASSPSTDISSVGSLDNTEVNQESNLMSKENPVFV